MEIYIDKVKGKRHRMENKGCEDIEYLREKPMFVFAGLADGQTGKEFCTLGGDLSLNVLADYFEHCGLPDISRGRTYDITRYDIARSVCEVLGSVASDLDCDITELSSTMMGIAVDKALGNFMVAHLGDGVVLGVTRDNELETIIRPEKGFTQYHTYLTTSIGMAAHIRLVGGNLQDYKQLYMLTDGAAELLASGVLRDHLEDALILGDVETFMKLLRFQLPQDDASILALKID